jgi:hypothetical protein
VSEYLFSRFHLSGKSATARHIALKFESDSFEVVPVCKQEDILLYGNFDRKQVFVLDEYSQ